LSTQTVDPSVLVITFRTSESKFLQLLSKNGELNSKWQKLASRRVRWYSPGLNIGAEEIIDSIWRTIDSARQQGIAIDRIVVDEVESASVGLPQLGRDPSFWTTLLELLGTEAITSFFGVMPSPEHDGAVCELLRSNADYVFSRENGSERWKTNKQPPFDGDK
jgi:hypothetical protein